VYVEAWQARASILYYDDRKLNNEPSAPGRNNSQSNLKKTGKTGKNSQTPFDDDAPRKPPSQATSRPLLPLAILLNLPDKNYPSSPFFPEFWHCQNILLFFQYVEQI